MDDAYTVDLMVFLLLFAAASFATELMMISPWPDRTLEITGDLFEHGLRRGAR